MATKTLKPRTSRLAPRLVIESGPHKGDEYIVRKQTTLIGRHVACDLVVDDAQVSRRHCQISWDGVYCTVEDLGSTNGTFINGQPLTAAYALRPGDKVQVANVIFQFADPQATLVGHKWPKLKIERATRRVTRERRAGRTLGQRVYAAALFRRSCRSDLQPGRNLQSRMAGI